MKNSCPFWGITRIGDELMKLGISIHKTTISRILKNLRKNGKINVGYSWAKFIKTYISSLFAQDFFTIQTPLGERLFVHFILELKHRKLVQFAVTKYPNTQFLKQQMILFEESVTGKKLLIHDNDPVFKYFDYQMYGIKGIRTSVFAPNMNAFAERFIRSVRHEALDNFVILGQRQLRNILVKYFHYYNFYRPHQGLGGEIPYRAPPMDKGKIRKVPVLDGLHYHYYRDAC